MVVEWDTLHFWSAAASAGRGRPDAVHVPYQAAALSAILVQSRGCDV
jgi:hypothetical protein